MATTWSSRHATHAPSTANTVITAGRSLEVITSVSARAEARLSRGPASAQERRDVDLVVRDLERGPLAVVDARAAVRRPRAPRCAGARAEPAAARAVEARGDHRDADVVAELLVDDRAEDDVRVGVGRGVDELGRLVDLEQPEVLAARDVEQDAGGALDGLLQQRRGDRGLGGLGGAVLPRRRADAHEGRAGVLHDRADVGEVEVDEAGDRDQVRDALDALAQDVVGLPEGVEDARAALDDREQLLVRDDDQRVDHLAQAVDALLRLARALRALELERAGDDADGQRADLVLGDLGDHGGRARAGAAALAGGDEHHVRALERLLDVVARLRGGALADLRVGARAEALGQPRPDVELDVRIGHLERLGVGVARDELHARQPSVDHAVDRIGPSAADTDDLYDCEIAASFHEVPVRTSSRSRAFPSARRGSDFGTLGAFRRFCQHEGETARRLASGLSLN